MRDGNDFDFLGYDDPPLKRGACAEIKRALDLHGKRTGSTKEATKTWRRHGTFRGSRNVEKDNE